MRLHIIRLGSPMVSHQIITFTLIGIDRSLNLMKTNHSPNQQVLSTQKLRQWPFEPDGSRGFQGVLIEQRRWSG